MGDYFIHLPNNQIPLMQIYVLSYLDQRKSNMVAPVGKQSSFFTLWKVWWFPPANVIIHTEGSGHCLNFLKKTVDAHSQTFIISWIVHWPEIRGKVENAFLYEAFIRLLTYMTLALANFVIGTAIDGRELRNLYKKVTSMCRQFSCFSRLFTVSPWKV